MNTYESTVRKLRSEPRRWLITGAAGFIGSNLIEELLVEGQHVIGVDNFSTGARRNLQDVRAAVGADAWRRFEFVEGDVRDLATCHRLCTGVSYVLHQAALGSVPRSIVDPLATNDSNVTGTLNMLVAARDARVERFVYAASSSTYGDHPGLPKIEDRIGRPLSPYAVTKYVSELYAGVFQRTYGLEVIGLRYFNVFGRRQDPDGAYAAVIPRWISNLARGVPCRINGDGLTSRDFCYVRNVVQANLLAAAARATATDQVYNIACGERITLRQLHALICEILVDYRPAVGRAVPEFGEFRKGDVRHSLADIGKARSLLGYEPQYDVRQGMFETIAWYLGESGPAAAGQAAMAATRSPGALLPEDGACEGGGGALRARERAGATLSERQVS